MANDNHHHKHLTSGVHTDIDFMDIDQVMVVPDTPDRVSKQPINISKISNTGESSSRKSVGEIRAIRDRRNQLFGDDIHSAGFYSPPRGKFGNPALKHGASSSVVPHSSSRHVLIPSGVDGKTFKHKERYHYNDKVVKNDKVSHSSFDKISHHHDHHYLHHRSKNPVLIEHGDVAKFSPKSKKDNLGARMMGEVYPHPSNIVSLNNNGASPKSHKSDYDGKMKVKVKVDHDDRINRNALSMKGSDKGKAKVKVDHDEPIHSNALFVTGNASVCSIDPIHGSEKGSTHSFRVPSNNSGKRLVRNGCISPLNIVKAKKIEDTYGTGIKNVEEIQVSGDSHPIIDVNEVTSKQNDARRAKGKGLLINDSSSVGHARGRNVAGNSNNERNKGKFPEDCIIVTDTPDNLNKNGIAKNTSFSSTSSANKSMRSEVQFRTPTASFRRPMKISGSSEKNRDVICLSSGGESSIMKPSRDHGGFSGRELGSLSAHNEFRGEERESISQIDNDSEAREIQLQADEMLARELQEQLYNETPIFNGIESVSPLGREEQQENPLEAPFSMESAGLHNAHDSVVAPPSFRRQGPQQSLRARLLRRGSQSRVPRSSLSRIRSQLYRQPRGRRNLLSHMDVEMRMHFLESLEAVYNEDISMVNQLLNSDREFGENDYEMLLTLDENNHRHLGASSAHIANLPVSTVNNDNCEVCSICLETPVIGDTMRHLPCLHKFHRDCIDSWLRRKRSCPVCKSDV